MANLNNRIVTFPYKFDNTWYSYVFIFRQKYIAFSSTIYPQFILGGRSVFFFFSMQNWHCQQLSIFTYTNACLFGDFYDIYNEFIAVLWRRKIFGCFSPSIVQYLSYYCAVCLPIQIVCFAGNIFSFYELLRWLRSIMLRKIGFEQ